MEEACFYVYAYCNVTKPLLQDQLRFEPFYVGKGCNNRINDHLRDAIAGKRGKKLSHIRNLIHMNAHPEIVMLSSGLTESEAFALEISLITKYGRLDLGTGCLFNNTPGGDGAKHTVETNKRIAEKLTGRKLPLEVCSRISKALTGKTRDDATKEKISNTLSGVKHSDQRCQNISKGTKNAAMKWQKKWLITTPETSFCILSLDYLNEIGIESLYGSFRSGKPISRGRLKGWSLTEIK